MPVIFLSVSTLWDGKWHHVSLSHIITLLYCCLAGSGKSCSKTIVKYCPFQLFSLSLYFSNQLFLLMWFFSFYPTTCPNNGLVSWRTVTECQTKHDIPFSTCCIFVYLWCIFASGLKGIASVRQVSGQAGSIAVGSRNNAAWYFHSFLWFLESYLNLGCLSFCICSLHFITDLTGLLKIQQYL